MLEETLLQEPLMYIVCVSCLLGVMNEYITFPDWESWENGIWENSFPAFSPQLETNKSAKA